MKWNPIYKKECKRSVRSCKTFIMILGYNFLLALIGLFAMFIAFQSGTYRGRIDYSDLLTIYSVIAVLEFGLVLFIVPALTAGTISGEREKQTLEILLTTTLKPSQIILGKLASSISLLLLLVISSLPILALNFTVGGIRILDLLNLILLCIVTALFIGSIGIFFSTLFKKTVPATVLTYGSVIVLILGTFAVIAAVILVLSVVRIDSYNMSPGLTGLPLVLLVNPAVTITSLLIGQFGSMASFSDFLTSFGQIPEFIVKHWFYLSLGVQLIIAILFIILSVRILNPLGRKRKFLQLKKSISK